METISEYEQGNYRPLVAEAAAELLEVRGELPQDLDGRLVRIGPNPLPVPGQRSYEWWGAPGMVHGVRLSGGDALWYRGRFIRDEAADALLGDGRDRGPRHGEGSHAPNTNVIAHAGRTLALVEGGALPVELSESLETIRRYDFDGTLNGGFTGHPKRDPTTGKLHAVSYYWAWDFVRHTVVGCDGRVERHVDVPVTDGPMIHDTAITDRYVVLMDLPVTFSLEGLDTDAALTGRALPYKWNPSHAARIGLLPKTGDAHEVVWHELPEPRWVFHTMNAFEEGDVVVVDVIAWDAAFTGSPFGEGEPCLERWILDPKSRRVTRYVIDDSPREFPRHDERRTGASYRYAYTIAFNDAQTGRITKHDLHLGATEIYDPGVGRSSMEAVFVPASPDAAEDDGWLLAYLHDANRDRAEVVVLHAQDITAGPVATIELPGRVPFGFHCNWLAATTQR